jgi:hypothetical protein
MASYSPLVFGEACLVFPMPHRSRPVPMLLINVDEVVVELPRLTAATRTAHESPSG